MEIIAWIISSFFKPVPSIAQLTAAMYRAVLLASIYAYGPFRSNGYLAALKCQTGKANNEM